MDIDYEKIRQAVKHTQILRVPKQKLSTFGTTNIYYYLITEPVYSELAGGARETVIREGKVIVERPRIVTPYYLSRLEGFSLEARRYFDDLIKAYGANAPGLFYTYRNESKGLTIVSSDLLSVAAKLNADIDRRGDPLSAIIRGEDELWDVSLLKFIVEITRESLSENLLQMGARGLLDVGVDGVPVEARIRIEELFRKVGLGECEPQQLKEELDRWDVFTRYEDRFYDIFRKRRAR